MALLVTAIAVAVTTSLVHNIAPVRAATHGNTDQYEAGDYVTSPIWSSSSAKVNQRYGCTDYNKETLITSASPLWAQVCIANGLGYWHHGIDVNLPSGTALYSPTSGKVAENSSGVFGVRDLSGQIVYLIHGYTVGGIGLGSLITAGQNVVSSDCVPPPGGSCSGPHLRLEVHSSLTFSQSTWDDINPEPWLQLQGPHAAAVSWGTNRLDVFIRGTDGNVYHKFTSDDTNWYPAGSGNYDSLGGAGGGFAGQVSAASWGANRLDLFAVGYDGNLWHKWYDSGSWHGWENISSQVPPGISSLVGTPSAVSYASGALSVFARAGSGTIVHIFYANAPWNWESHGGYSTTDPAAIAGPNRIDLVVYGRKGDSTVGSGYAWHQSWTPSGWSPSMTGYDNWGAAGNGFGFVGQPAEAFFSGTNIDALGVSADGALWDTHYNGTSWGSLQQITGSGGPSGVIGSASAIDTPNGGLFSLLVRGTDGALWDCWPGGPSGTTCAWKAHGGQITNDPLVVSAAPWREDVFVRATSPFYLAHQLYANSGWLPCMTGCYDNFGGVMS